MAKGRVSRKRNGYADPKQFRTKNGHFAPAAIFLEAPSRTEHMEPFYTLQEFDDEERDLPSAYQIFMDSIDEYEAAMRIVGSTRFWDRLCRSSWFMKPTPTNPVPGFDGILSWRQDKLAMQQNKVRRILLDKAEEGDVAAARKIFDECKPNTGKGASFRKEEEVRRRGSSDNAKIIEMHNRAKGV